MPRRLKPSLENKSQNKQQGRNSLGFCLDQNQLISGLLLVIFQAIVHTYSWLVIRLSTSTSRSVHGPLYCSLGLISSSLSNRRVTLPRVNMQQADFSIHLDTIIRQGSIAHWVTQLIIGHHHALAIHGWNWVGVASSSMAGSIIWVLPSASSLLSHSRLSGATVGFGST